MTLCNLILGSYNNKEIKIVNEKKVWLGRKRSDDKVMDLHKMEGMKGRSGQVDKIVAWKMMEIYRSPLSSQFTQYASHPPRSPEPQHQSFSFVFCF